MLPDLVPDPPIRSKVRIGIKVNGRPTATDTFHSDDPVFIEKLGTPSSLDITIPFAQPHEALRTGLEMWLANQTLKCWSKDGVTANRLARGGSYQEVPCKYKDCQQYQAKNCSQIGRLRFNIPALGPGLFVMDTKGWNTMAGILGALQLAEPCNDKRFTLSIEKRKNAKKQTYSVVILTLQGEEE